LAAKYEKEAQRYWDLFYKKNQEKFFKDRHYLFREFSELTPPEGSSCHEVLEVRALRRFGKPPPRKQSQGSSKIGS
jgi:hypothetical protein